LRLFKERLIKDTEGKTFIEIPLSFGVIGVLAAPIVAAVGALAGVASNFSLKVVKTDEPDTADFTEIVEDDPNNE